jgi:OPA family glycerol-3-phosphate transporter-like MFS transporter
MSFAIVAVIVGAIVAIYFFNNPLKHGGWFMARRFINWFPLGLTYAFLCMGRYNVIVAKSALGELMTKEDLGIIFGVGTWVYALSFLVNGPLIDKKLGGKRGIIIAAVGAAAANLALGVLTWLIIARGVKVHVATAFTLLYAVNMYFQSYGAMSIIKVKAYWFHVRERGVFGAIFGTLISAGVYLAFDWGPAIIGMTRAQPTGHGGWIEGMFRAIFVPAGATHDAIWTVFFVPAALLIGWAVLDLWLIKDTPEEAGFPQFDTCDASSGQMHLEFSVWQLLGKIFANPLMLLIATVELTSGVFRYSMTEWYPLFGHETGQAGAAFFVSHWGVLLFVFGVIGGFAGGLISDHLFQSRRGPPAAMLCGLVLVLALVMWPVLFSAPSVVGWSAVLIVMCSIGITSLMSGTAATDFGGRKATATCAGVVDGFAYLGSGLQSISLGYITTRDWHWWPLFLVPFAVIGLGVSMKIWKALPPATRKYITEVEEKAVAEVVK